MIVNDTIKKRLVLKGGLEPPRAKAHCPLKTACLPVPPLQQTKFIIRLRFRYQVFFVGLYSKSSCSMHSTRVTELILNNLG